ncbi:MAG: hypothetical protein Kow0069_04210 [Promethearchaeota archaeon]
MGIKKYAKKNKGPPKGLRELPLILVVEDDESIVLGLKTLLAAEGYAVATAGSGEQALRYFEERNEAPPDLVICDVLMPGIDGYEFFQKFQSKFPESKVPFIFLSALSSPEDSEVARGLGANEYLSKPFDPEKLLRLVRKNLERREISLQFSEISKSRAERDGGLYHAGDVPHLVYVSWDDSLGPVLVESWPRESGMEKIGSQLFDASLAVYGHQRVIEPQTVLLRVANISVDAFLLFDSAEDVSFRGNERLYLLAVLAPSISYLQSLRLTEVLRDASKELRDGGAWNGKDTWKRVRKVLGL